MQHARLIAAVLAATVLLLGLPARAASGWINLDWDPTDDPDIVVIGPGTT